MPKKIVARVLPIGKTPNEPNQILIVNISITIGETMTYLNTYLYNIKRDQTLSNDSEKGLALTYTPKRVSSRLGNGARGTSTQVSVPGVKSIRGVSSARPVIGRRVT